MLFDFEKMENEPGGLGLISDEMREFLTKVETSQKWAEEQQPFTVAENGMTLSVTPCVSGKGSAGWQVFMVNGACEEYAGFIRGENIPTNEQLFESEKNPRITMLKLQKGLTRH